MRVILFQPQFAELVRAGTKTQTIRKTARCTPGDTLSLRRWTGKPYRTKQETLRTVTCTAVRNVRIGEPWPDGLVIDGVEMPTRDRASVARQDGFRCMTEMLDWFDEVHGLPFEGVLIEWSNAGGQIPPASGGNLDRLVRSSESKGE